MEEIIIREKKPMIFRQCANVVGCMQNFMLAQKCRIGNSEFCLKLTFWLNDKCNRPILYQNLEAKTYHYSIFLLIYLHSRDCDEKFIVLCSTSCSSLLLTLFCFVLASCITCKPNCPFTSHCPHGLDGNL